jgi:hypothetical protein
MKTTDTNAGITRIDIAKEGGKGATHGWEVRIRRRHVKDEVFFSDREHGGKTGALDAAQKYRDKMDRDIPRYSRREVAEIASKRNSSGVVGVRLAEKRVGRGEDLRLYKFWTAFWSPAPGRRKSRAFSVEKFGEEEAYKLAVAAARRRR